MQSIELIQAEAKAADLCLTILTDAGLIGENLVTKLRDAQQAILACLPKMYAACNVVEKETGKNMYRVAEVVVQMFSRAKWADHDAMMTRVEALLVAFVEAAKAAKVAAIVPVEVTEQATATPAQVVEMPVADGLPRADAEEVRNALALEKIESLLKANAIDFLNEADAMDCLSGCVLATKLQGIYQEELAKRRQEAFGLRVGQDVETPVGRAVVECFDRFHIGEVKIRFPGSVGATTTHYSKLLPC